MRILDKYILSELLGPFVFGVCAFSSIVIGTSTLFRLAKYVTQYGASFMTVAKLFIYSLPSIIVLTFPMSMLLASLLSFGRLSGASEITAMKSGGISFYRLAAPVFIVALFVSIFAVYFNELVVPAANTAYRDTLYYEVEKNTKPRNQEHVVIKNVKEGNIERLTYAKRFDEDTSTMYAVTMQEFENDKLVRVENAEKALWQQDTWVMYNGIIYDLSDSTSERTLRFNQQILPISTKPADIGREQKKPEEMTIKELKQQIKIYKQQFLATNTYEVELHHRIAIPMACLVFALIGTPLGLQPQRASSSIGLGLSIIIIFIYYGIFTIATALGNGGVVHPFLAAWIPNLIGIGAGAYLVRRASQ